MFVTLSFGKEERTSANSLFLIIFCFAYLRLQRFLADFRDLTSWVTEMKALINADELANDVAGAEALLDRHQEHKVEWLYSEISQQHSDLYV